MARPLSEIEAEIRRLARDEQERLLRTLVEELDGPADADAERAWLEEVRRRSRELEDGSVRPIPGDAVFEKLRAVLRQ